jgi:hypothetical protein
MKKLAYALLAVLLVGVCFTGVAVAENHNTTEDREDGEDGDTIVNIDLDGVTEAVQDLIDTFQEFTGSKSLTEILTAVLFAPFRTLAQQLLNVVARLLTTTPQVHPNPAVEEIHRDVLIISYLLSTLVFMAAGILYMVGPILGFSYSEIRVILPRVIAALVFGTISLPVLQLAVDLTNALSTAFAPEGLVMSNEEMLGLTTGLALVWVFKAIALLALVLLFVIRAVYILFGAAISPLLALMWSIPRVRRYADTFIAGWWAALMIAPLDLLVLQFSLALMRGSGASNLQSISNWVFGLASLVLLLFVPLQVWRASQTAVGQARTAGRILQSRKNSSDSIELSSDEQRRLERYRERKNGGNSSGGNKFNNYWGGSDD